AAASSSAAERARVLVRLALLAEGDAGRSADALALYGRALDEEAPPGGAALARAGLRRVAARLNKDLELLRGLTLESEAALPGVERAPWLATAAAVARHRLGATERAATLLEAARADDPDDAALLAAVAEDHVAAGRWREGRAALDHQAELT